MFLWKIPRFMWVKLEHPHYLIRAGRVAQQKGRVKIEIFLNTEVTVAVVSGIPRIISVLCMRAYLSVTKVFIIASLGEERGAGQQGSPLP